MLGQKPASCDQLLTEVFVELPGSDSEPEACSSKIWPSETLAAANISLTKEVGEFAHSAGHVVRDDLAEPTSVCLQLLQQLLHRQFFRLGFDFDGDLLSPPEFGKSFTSMKSWCRSGFGPSQP